MKKLCIIRHAKSNWNNQGQADFERQLSERGELNAPIMGKKLKGHGVCANAIITSPAIRAIRTAQLIAEQLSFPEADIEVEQLIYEASLDDLLGILCVLDDTQENVILCGHNPGFSELANYFCRFNRVLPTCGVVCVEFNVNSWGDVSPENANMLFFTEPSQV